MSLRCWPAMAAPKEPSAAKAARTPTITRSEPVLAAAERKAFSLLVIGCSKLALKGRFCVCPNKRRCAIAACTPKPSTKLIRIVFNFQAS